MLDSRLSPAEKSLRGKVAAHASWAACDDRSARTRAAREAFNDKFLAEAGGDPVRAESLRKSFYASLAFRSAQARRKARELGQVADAAEALLAGGVDDAVA